MTDLLKLIQDANSTRVVKTLERRILKLSEEQGELSQAYLSVSSPNNSKRKKWKHVREEAVDAAVVAIDVALTRLPEELLTDEEIIEDVMKNFEKKIKKWLKKKNSQMDTTTGVDDEIHRNSIL